ncbi:hypothetical protein ACOY50_20695, partial [Enterobacter asburiae]|uniref:hypothetical protein n=1 Tax=Enterobacter asburiae TaxID=61645 RepID=UPI003BC02061
KRAYCLKTQPATGETYPKSDLFNKAPMIEKGSFHINQKVIFSMLLQSCLVMQMIIQKQVSITIRKEKH